MAPLQGLTMCWPLTQACAGLGTARLRPGLWLSRPFGPDLRRQFPKISGAIIVQVRFVGVLL
jgi:hypothetical protein